MSRLYITDLATALWWQLSDDASDWLKTALHKLSPEENKTSVVEDHLRFSATARRKLGTKVLDDLPGRCQWQADEAGRLLLLAQLVETSAINGAELIKAAFKFGDENEKMAIIKGLCLIDPEAQLVDLAVATGRTNSVDLFSAIALNNPYPVQNYDDRAFHQLVLKSLFMDLDIKMMIGLKSRLSPKLSALAMDLVNERLAAGRIPPISIWLAIDFIDLRPAEQTTYLTFVTDEEPLQRYYCLLSLLRCMKLESWTTQNVDATFWSILEQQNKVEHEARIKTLLSAALDNK